MENIKRVEIIVPHAEKDSFLKLFAKEKVEGFTLIEKVSGMGNRGMQDGLGLSDAFTNTLIIWYCSIDKFESMKELIRSMLEESGGICAVADAQWVKH
ncbi:MAG: hypothetical protein DA405_10050 [Bacteroidetes bacterium]|nr:MAG: hypothetical protein DA405_10050 [Bacteroidota bacterium]